VKERGFDLLKLGFFGAIPGISAVAFGWLAGYVADLLSVAYSSLTVAATGIWSLPASAAV
jgi:ACS family D-galactonate transporter-like MFS transporter